MMIIEIILLSIVYSFGIGIAGAIFKRWGYYEEAAIVWPFSLPVVVSYELLSNTKHDKELAAANKRVELAAIEEKEANHKRRAAEELAREYALIIASPEESAVLLKENDFPDYVSTSRGIKPEHDCLATDCNRGQSFSEPKAYCSRCKGSSIDPIYQDMYRRTFQSNKHIWFDTFILKNEYR